MKQLVILLRLNEHSQAHWPTLGHYIGQIGAIVETDTDADGSKHYIVEFDPSPSIELEQSDIQNRRWAVEPGEISRLIIPVGTVAFFRANATDVPLPVNITDIQKLGGDFVTYSFVGLSGEEFHNVPEEFLRPSPHIELGD